MLDDAPCADCHAVLCPNWGDFYFLIWGFLGQAFATAPTAAGPWTVLDADVFRMVR